METCRQANGVVHKSKRWFVDGTDIRVGELNAFYAFFLVLDTLIWRESHGIRDLFRAGPAPCFTD